MQLYLISAMINRTMEGGSSIEQEIVQLEKQLQERRAALEHKPSDSEALPSEKETFREVVTEKIQQHAPQYTPPPVIKNTDNDERSYLSQELKDKIQELINTVFNKSLNDGIKEAVQSDNPALIDAFHDVLVDELYETLLERKKVIQVQ